VLPTDVGRSNIYGQTSVGPHHIFKALRVGVQAFRRHRGFFAVGCRGFVWVRSCDNAKLQLDLLKEKSDLDMAGRACVFNDIHSRLSPTIRGWLESMQPSDKDQPSEAEAAHEGMRQLLRTYQGTAYPLDGTCYCVQHQRQCIVYPLYALSAARGQAALAAQSRTVRGFVGIQSSQNLGSLQKCESCFSPSGIFLILTMCNRGFQHVRDE
jgi:hypothetical protein